MGHEVGVVRYHSSAFQAKCLTCSWRHRVNDRAKIYKTKATAEKYARAHQEEMARAHRRNWFGPLAP